MPNRLFLWVQLLLLLAAATPVSATSVTLRGDRLQRRLLSDAGDGQLDDFDLLSAALVAGGVDDENDLQHYQQLFKQRRVDPLPSAADPRAAAQDCLRLLHRELLSGRYHVEYTQLARVLDEGHFNCVTATVLYDHLCRQAGLSPVIMATREHVFVRFLSDGGWDVETTCADWFVRQKTTELSAVRSDSTDVRTIGAVALLGKIYYNRAVQLLSEQRYRDAIELLQTSIDLDPADQPAHENLLAAINNWSLDLCRRGQFERAVELLDWGRELDASYRPFVANDLHIHQRWMLHLCRQQRFEEALLVLSEGYQRRPDAPVFDEGRMAVYRLWSEHHFAAAEHDEAWQAPATGRAQFGDDRRWAAYEAAAVATFVRILHTEKSPEHVMEELQRGLDRYPDSPLLQHAVHDLTKAQL